MSGIDIHLLIRYKNSSDLKKLFSELSVDIIDLDEDGREYIYHLIETIPSVSQRELQRANNPFWSYLLILSHIRINEELAEKVLDTLNSLDSNEYIVEKKDGIISFVNHIYNLELFREEGICSRAMAFLIKLLLIVTESKHAEINYSYVVLLLNEFCKEGELHINDLSIIHLLIEKDKEVLLTELYGNCSENLQSIIRDHFNNWQFKDTYQDCKLYVNLLLSEIIDPDTDIEQKAIEHVRKSLQREKEIENKGIHSFPPNDLLSRFVEAVRADKINNIQAIKDIADETEDEFSKWLLDIDNYDYEKFKLNWISLCYPVLLEKVASNTRAKEEILKAFKTQYIEEGVDEFITKKIVQYFME